MKKILRTELTILKLKQAGLILSMDINDPDGGLDAYISNEIPESHPWMPPGKSGWQFKAQRGFSVSEVANEVLNDEKNALKPRIKKLLDEQGTYVLVFGGKDYVPADLEEREEKLAETIASMGYPEGKSKILSSGQIADWASSLLSVVAYLQPERQNFKDFYEWQKSIVANREFVPDSARQKAITDVRQAIIDNQNKDSATIIRLVGLSGVGKTRLAYECLDAENLREITLYLESPDKLPASRFNVIAQNNETRVIFVVDECPHNKFVELAREAESIGGRMTLISLDYDIDRPRSAQDKHIILDPLDQAASEELIKKTVPNLPENARKKIAEYSEGFPLILIILSLNFNLKPEFLSPTTLDNLGINEILDRIIAGRGESVFELAEVRKTLTAISLFKRLGWDEESSTQGQKICELHGIEWMQARQIVEEQERRKLVVKRGRYRYVTPLPLAINLASKWLSSMDLFSVGKYFDNLPDAETKKAFLERLADFGYTEYAEEITKGFLSSFDFKSLNTSIGSEIFLNLSKTDHKYSMEILEKILGLVPREKLLSFKAGRRNVIWTLEKIAWWADTFAKSARTLLKLADAENEEWSNNATGTFVNLFQTYLGGTEVPIWERYSILEEAIDSNNKNIQKISLKAIDATLRLTHAFRMSSAEEQGVTIIPPEWNPRSKEDIQKAVYSALTLIDKSMDVSDRDIQIGAASLVLSNARTLLNYGFLNEALVRLKRIEHDFPELEVELVKTVERILYYDKKLPGNIIETLQKYRDSLIGSDYQGLMKRYVKSDIIQDHVDGKRADVENKIKELAKESIVSPAKLEKELHWLVTNQAENGYLFGKALGEIDVKNEWLEKIEKQIHVSENPSTLFFGGYLYSLKLREEQLYQKTLVGWLGHEKLLKLLPELVWRSGPSDGAAKLIIHILKERQMNPTEIRLFTYGAWFSSLNLDTFVQLLEEFYKIDDGKYASATLGIIDQYVEKNKAILMIKGIILKFLSATSFNGDEMTAYYWDKLSTELMKRDPETIPHILDLLLKTLSTERIIRFENYFSKELQFSLKQNNKMTWNKIKDILLDGDLASWRLLEIIRGELGAIGGSRSSLLSLIPEDELWKWVDQNPAKAPYILARMIPLHEAEPLLHPIAKKLLLRFSEDDRVRDVLSSNWHTEMYSGKASVHYQSKLNIAQEWFKDPEPAVSKWAEGEMAILKEMIKAAKNREEEENKY
jgi:hypothetical protein